MGRLPAAQFIVEHGACGPTSSAAALRRFMLAPEDAFGTLRERVAGIGMLFHPLRSFAQPVPSTRSMLGINLPVIDGNGGGDSRDEPGVRTADALVKPWAASSAAAGYRPYHAATRSAAGHTPPLPRRRYPDAAIGSRSGSPTRPVTLTLRHR